MKKSRTQLMDAAIFQKQKQNWKSGNNQRIYVQFN